MLLALLSCPLAWRSALPWSVVSCILTFREGGRTVKDEARQFEGERSELQDLLQSAQEAVVGGRERLRRLLAEARSLSSQYRTRQITTQARLSEVRSRLEQVTSEPGSSGSPVELVELQNEYQGLRQQQAWLAENLVECESAQRRLRAALKQIDASSACLKREIDAAEQAPEGLAQPWRARVLQAEEDERQRLAREVHDGPAQVLANAIFELEYCERLLEKDPIRLRTELARLKRDVREGLADVRYFIFGLRPAPLADVGLEATLRRYVEDYQSRFGIRVELGLDEIPRLPSTYEVALFRIVQEALQNVQKHSGARSVQVEVRNLDGALSLIVQDNGRGFDASREAGLERKRFGLVGMRERARLIRGELEISSQPGSGTRVQLTVPGDVLRSHSDQGESD